MVTPRMMIVLFISEKINFTNIAMVDAAPEVRIPRDFFGTGRLFGIAVGLVLQNSDLRQSSLTQRMDRNEKMNLKSFKMQKNKNCKTF